MACFLAGLAWSISRAVRFWRCEWAEQNEPACNFELCCLFSLCFQANHWDRVDGAGYITSMNVRTGLLGLCSVPYKYC